MTDSRFEHEAVALRSAIERLQEDLHHLCARLDQLEASHQAKQALPRPSPPTALDAELSSEPEPGRQAPPTSPGAPPPRVTLAPNPRGQAPPAFTTHRELDVDSEQKASVRTEPQAAAPESGGGFELRVGRTWLNRAGAVILFLSVAFFIKYAFDQGWLSPSMRVKASAAFGLALIAAGELCFTRMMRTFAAGILGCGVAVLYVAVYGAHGFYQLISVDAAGSFYVLVTALTIGIAVHRRLLAVAFIAVIGGFGTPFVLSSGTNQQVALLVYTIALDVGLLASAAFRRWDSLRPAAWLGTALVFGAWALQFYAPAAAWQTAGFVLAFYLLFHAETLISLHRGTVRYPRLSALILHADNTAFILATYFLLRGTAPQVVGLVALVAAALQWLAAWQGCRPDEQCAPARRALWYDGACLLALVAPLLFDRYLVSVSWTVQAAVTFYFCRKVPSLWLRAKGLGVLLAASLHLLIYDHRDAELGRVFAALGPYTFAWITVCFGFVACGAYAAGAVLLVRRRPSKPDVNLAAYVIVLGTALLLGIFADQWGRYAATWAWIALTLAWALFAWWVPPARVLPLALTGIVCAKFLGWDTMGPALAGNQAQVEGLLLNPLVLTGLGVAGLTALMYPWTRRLPTWITADTGVRSLGPTVWLLLAVVLVWTGTFEIMRAFEVDQFRHRFDDSRLAMHVALSIFWGASALVILIVGFACRIPPLRHLALVLFGVTVVKVFVVDLGHLEMIYRIVSFAVLGFLLLSASLLYQRLAARLERSPAPGIDKQEE